VIKNNKKLLMGVFVLLFLASLSAADLRAEKLKSFLDRYPWSPLRGHEQEIVYCADKFGIDYRLYIAIAGAESSYGKRYKLKNLTGYNNCNSGFKSIYENIYYTSELIGTSKYYKKYRSSKNIWDLIYTYKGVPPYNHYYDNMRYALDQIHQVPISAELKRERAKLAYINSTTKQKNVTKKAYHRMISSWLTPKFHQYPIRQLNHLSFKVAAKQSANY
jgi:hypothetical protein